jgi:uncharacterized Zn-binding protein involved in type VI secretion
MPPAARVTDTHVCTMADPPVPTPHVGGPIKPPCSTTVKTNSLGQARATDQLQCTGSPAPNFIVTGSTTVLVNGLMAARQTDKTMHPPPGAIGTGSPNVDIGGPTGGATLGNPTAGTAACNLAATGRVGGSTAQSGQNCSLESPRQIINQVAPPPPGTAGLTEQQLLNWAATPGSGISAPVTSAFPAEQVTVLANYGVVAHQEASTSANLAQRVAEGRGVTASLDAAPIWGGATPVGTMHTVLVTGVQYDQNGNLANVIVNDTGTGNCGVSYPAANFQNAMNGANYPGGNLVVTNNRAF